MVKNTIAVFIKDGQVVTGFFEEDAGRQLFEAEKTKPTAAHFFILDPAVDAEFMLLIAPDLRAKVHDAEQKLRRFLDIEGHFDAAGLTKDPEVRRAAHKGLSTWYDGVMGAAFSR